MHAIGAGDLNTAAILQNSGYSWWVARRGSATGILLEFLGVGFLTTSFVAPRLLEGGISWQEAPMWMTVVPNIVCLGLFCVTVKFFARTNPDATTTDDLVVDSSAMSRKSMRFDLVPQSSTMSEGVRRQR